MIIERPSPNHDERPAGTPVDMLVLHYTGMQTGDAAIARLCDPAAKVSSHYVVEEDGRCSSWSTKPGAPGMRGSRPGAASATSMRCSIGIEIVNPGHEFGYRDFPSVQMAAVAELARGIVARHKIPARNVVGHSDVAPARKDDPGERFDWGFLAAHGVGLWPLDGKGALPPDLATAQRLLAAYGYDVAASGQNDETTTKAIVAFQRHFRPARIDGVLDAETMARLTAVAALAK